MFRRRFVAPLLLLLAAAGLSGVIYAQLESSRSRDPADRQLGNAGNHRHPRRRRRRRRAVGALRRLAHRPAPGIPRAVRQDASRADQPGADAARQHARPDRQLDQRRAGGDRPAAATSPTSASCSTAPARREFLGVEGGAGAALRADAADPGDGHRRHCDDASSCGPAGNGRGRSSGRRRARSTMSGSAASAPTRC